MAVNVSDVKLAINFIIPNLKLHASSLRSAGCPARAVSGTCQMTASVNVKQDCPTMAVENMLTMSETKRFLTVIAFLDDRIKFNYYSISQTKMNLSFECLRIKVLEK